MLLLEWAGLARRSEIAGLELERWRIEEGALVVEWSGAGYRRAKGDQSSEGSRSTLPLVVLGFPLGELMMEHRAELESWGLSGRQKMFRNVLDPRRSAWDAGGEAVNKLLKRVVQDTVRRHGLERPSVDRYSSHSLRRGGAQYLRDSGVPRDLIKIMGRWRSDAVDEYLKTASTKTVRFVASLFVGQGACWKATT